jgi:hypothetical protein
MTQLGAALYRCARAASVETDPTWVPPTTPDIPLAVEKRVHSEALTGGDAYVTREGTTVSLFGESYEAFAEMIKLLLQDRRIVDACDSETIRDQALVCADEAARSAADGRLSQAKANELASDLRRRLLGPYEETEYFVLVPGLVLPGPVTIGTVPLRPVVAQHDADDLWQRLADQEHKSARSFERVWRAAGIERPPSARRHLHGPGQRSHPHQKASVWLRVTWLSGDRRDSRWPKNGCRRRLTF